MDVLSGKSALFRAHENMTGACASGLSFRALAAGSSFDRGQGLYRVSDNPDIHTPVGGRKIPIRMADVEFRLASQRISDPVRCRTSWLRPPAT
ncbi:hypothetical protein IP76_14815 [Rhizobium sp. AAP43]|nr:hypothetical protein IP76_14815 [Rhizobium sp. AAP43]